MPSADPAIGRAAAPPTRLATAGVADTTPRLRRVRQVLMTADAVGGVWRYAMDLAAALSPRGVRTTLAVMGPPPTDRQRLEARRLGIAVAYQPFRLEWMPDPWDDVRHAGDWLLDLEAAVRPDVVHLNGYAHAPLPWSAPAVVVGHSCVRSWWRAVKGTEAPERFGRYRDAVLSGLHAARVVIAPTAAMLRALHDEYGVLPRSRVIANGTSDPGGGGEPRWASKEPFVLAAGRVWDEAKNLQAVCAVTEAWPWPVYVAGDQHDPDGDVRTLSGVRALGRLDREQLSEWQRRAAIFASPACYEPFGLSILEAAAAGCALVLGDIGSLRENWDGAALFVPPCDTAAVGRGVGSLIADPVQRRRLSRAAWQRAAQFTIDRTADAYVRAYEDVVS